ncbi:hypothetical protein ACLKMH_21390 [Psychromonas sp. KJ10-10]
MQHKLFSVNDFREQFPILDQQVNDHSLIYLDNADNHSETNVSS